jgi:glycosyltransferase involved in cell wall biosynthesis
MRPEHKNSNPLLRVALDVSHLDHAKLSGVGVYTMELLRGLRRRPELQMQPVFRLSRWRKRRQFSRHAGIARPWLAGGFGLGADVLHGPDFFVGSGRRVRRVVTIHDLGFLTEGMTSPEFARKKTRDLNELLDERTPDAIIAISQATQRELLRYRPRLADRIHQIYLGGDHLASATDELPALADSSPYFLFVGNLEARKNVLGIMQAFERFRQPGYQGQQILQRLQASPVAADIQVVGYCAGEELQNYYRNAVALVYPSWIEGFGIPVVEAMRLGCPVITSRTTSTAEIAGDAAWLVDPGDTAEISGAMEKAFAFVGDPEARKAWSERAIAQAARFTWDACAAQTATIYAL